jgi:hypothetical protein
VLADVVATLRLKSHCDISRFLRLISILEGGQGEYLQLLHKKLSDVLPNLCLPQTQSICQAPERFLPQSRTISPIDEFDALPHGKMLNSLSTTRLNNERER